MGAKENRLRKTAILCLHCTRNLAYYLNRQQRLLEPVENQFWRTVDGNFLDICVLEWCKLFADNNGKHHWKKVIIDNNRFYEKLLAEMNCCKNEFTEYINEMKTYRDKFLAHLDNENTMNIPNLDKAKTSVIFLYNHLLTHEEINNCYYDAPKIKDYFSIHSNEANEIYRNI